MPPKLKFLFIVAILITTFTNSANAVVSRDRFEQIKQKYSIFPVFYYDSSETVNAFAVPAIGAIYVSKGFLDLQGTNEENLAVVLLHENAHIILQHTSEAEETSEDLIYKERQADYYAFKVAKRLGILSNRACWYPFYEFPLSNVDEYTHPSQESRWRTCLSVLNEPKPTNKKSLLAQALHFLHFQKFLPR